MDSVRKIGLILSLVFLSACQTTRKEAELCKSTRSLPSMGTFITVGISFDCQDPFDENLFVEIQKRLDDLENQFSLYIKDSDLSRWNRGERDFKPRDDFHKLFAIARQLYVKTDGYFDIGVYKMRGIPYTFDGIAKGYAVDEVALLIEEHELPYYRIDFSGNLKWKSDNGSGAAASSGNRHRPGHIINPIKKARVLMKDEVLVQGPSATICDALSTAVFAGYLLSTSSDQFINYRAQRETLP